jgi:hypothetical protein
MFGANYVPIKNTVETPSVTEFQRRPDDTNHHNLLSSFLQEFGTFYHQNLLSEYGKSCASGSNSLYSMEYTRPPHTIGPIIVSCQGVDTRPSVDNFTSVTSQQHSGSSLKGTSGHGSFQAQLLPTNINHEDVS